MRYSPALLAEQGVPDIIAARIISGEDVHTISTRAVELCLQHGSPADLLALPRRRSSSTSSRFKAPVGDAREAAQEIEAKAFAGRRINEIGALVMLRHGGPCDTDDGEVWFEAALPHLALKAYLRDRSAPMIGSADWADTVTPRLLTKGRGWFEAREREFYPHWAVDDRPRLPTALRLGSSLSLRTPEREAIGITTIAACDLSPEEAAVRAKERKREKDRERQQEKRAAQPEHTPRGKSVLALHERGLLGVTNVRAFYRLPKDEQAVRLASAREEARRP